MTNDANKLTLLDANTYVIERGELTEHFSDITNLQKIGRISVSIFCKLGHFDYSFHRSNSTGTTK